MAIVDQKSIFKTLRQNGKEELRAGVFSRPEIVAAVQSVEDSWEASLSKVKADAESALGKSITAEFFNKLLKSWLLSKGGK